MQSNRKGIQRPRNRMPQESQIQRLLLVVNRVWRVYSVVVDYPLALLYVSVSLGPIHLKG